MNHILEQGLILMVLGMGVVFAFLSLLVIIMNLSAKIILRFFPEKEEPVPQQADASAEIAAAIAAVTYHTRH